MIAQITTAKKERRNYPKKKRLIYHELQELPKNYDVIALSKMTGVRATQLMAIRKKFRDTIKILIIKNKVAQRAFEKITSVKGLANLSKELEGQCALMFTNINAFKLNLILNQSKVFLPAKGGDIATKEIMISAGNTGITPGPVLSEFKEANVPTKIDQGSIWVTKDTVTTRPGDVISTKLASLMSKLNIKPIEAGITVNSAIAEGLFFKGSDLQIDLVEYRKEFERSFREAIALSIETVKPLLVRAQQDAIALAAESGYMSSDTAEFVLQRAQIKAKVLKGEAKKKGYVSE
jgi:large subunit ribosomal protein L10